LNLKIVTVIHRQAHRDDVTDFRVAAAGQNKHWQERWKSFPDQGFTDNRAGRAVRPVEPWLAPDLDHLPAGPAG